MNNSQASEVKKKKYTCFRREKGLFVYKKKVYLLAILNFKARKEKIQNTQAWQAYLSAWQIDSSSAVLHMELSFYSVFFEQSKAQGFKSEQQPGYK